MSILVLVGTIKGAFLIRSDADRRSRTVIGPLFKGWKVTAAARTTDGEILVATVSDFYGPALHRSLDLESWT